MKPCIIHKIFKIFELRRKLLRIRFMALDHVSEVLPCKTCQMQIQKKKKKAILLVSLGLASCCLLDLSVEAVRIRAKIY